jgi:hypothetical protein
MCRVDDFGELQRDVVIRHTPTDSTEYNSPGAVLETKAGPSAPLLFHVQLSS